MCWLRRLILVWCVVLPLLSGAWGTISRQLPMTDDEREKLTGLIDNYSGARTARNKAEMTPRLGPHLTHQFIVRQAYFLLDEDPATDGSSWQLPHLNSVLSWDGVVRRTEPPDGMQERADPVYDTLGVLAPPKRNGIGGPSADAELTADGQWNTHYRASNHYWNPWLECGDAPKAVGSCYVTLLRAMRAEMDLRIHPVDDTAAATTKPKIENAKAQAVSHLAHYLADTVCPKHADMIALTGSQVETLSGFSREWFAEHERTPTLTLAKWLESDQVTRAQTLIIRASGVSLADPFWRRVNTHIADTPLFTPNNSSIRGAPDIGRQSLRNAVAGYLTAVHHLGDKDPERFYGFFDPFYFNGQLVMTYDKYSTDWNPPSTPVTALVSPGGDHMLYEGNPNMARYVASNVGEPIFRGGLKGLYQALPDHGDLWAFDEKTRLTANRKAMDRFIREVSLTAHGNTPADGDDFNHDNYEQALQYSVRCVFNALRSSITAMRCQATYAYFPEEKKYRIYCDLRNVADEPVAIKGMRVFTLRDGKKYSESGWRKSLGFSVAKGKGSRVTITVPAGKVTEEHPRLFIDIFGRYEKTPDLGFWRGEVSQRPGRIMKGMSLPAFDRVEGPLDLIICFDVTSSMSSSIDSVRNNAITVLTALKKRLPDLRVALVSFRDITADKTDAFTVTPFSRDISGVIGKMRGWKARGGGDIPEDQLAAIRKGLDLWGRAPDDPRKPTKIVVVITDATFHTPDVKGNTMSSIVDYAEKVDPAHIYPIVVGGNAEAHAQAAELARLTGGEVLSAKSGDETAKVLADAVARAVATHGFPGPRIPPWALFYGGIVALVIGVFWWRRARRVS